MHLYAWCNIGERRKSWFRDNSLLSSSYFLTVRFCKQKSYLLFCIVLGRMKEMKGFKSGLIPPSFTFFSKTPSLSKVTVYHSWMLQFGCKTYIRAGKNTTSQWYLMPPWQIPTYHQTPAARTAQAEFSILTQEDHSAFLGG